MSSRLLTRDAASRLVEAGGVVVYPTETVWGIGGSALLASVLDRVLAIKGIPGRRPVPVLASCRRGVLDMVDPSIHVWVLELVADLWPGSLTLALPLKDDRLVHVAASDGTVGFRVSANATATWLALAAGGYLLSTSANVSGEPPPSRSSDVTEAVVSACDGVLDDPLVAAGQSSTVLALEGSKWRVVRPGAVPVDRLAKLSSLKVVE